MSLPRKRKKVSKYVPRDRVAEALATVVRDTDGKYDECLFDRLLDSASAYLKSNIHADTKIIMLYENLKSGEDGEINTTRLLKLHKSLIDVNTPTRVLTNNFLDVVPSIMIKNNLSEVSATLSLLLALSYDTAAFKDLAIKRFIFNERLMNDTPSRDDNLCQVTNILTLARYYMQTSKNYHIEEDAKHLFKYLILELSEHPSTSVLVEELKQILEDLLMNVKTPMVYHLMYELFEIAPDNCVATELFQYIKRLLRLAFERALEEQSRQSLLGLSRCLAEAKISIAETLDKLKRANNLDAIIMYVTNINVFNNQTGFYYVIYPILARCDSEDAQVIAAKLFMTRDEKYFIERNLNDSIVQQCLTYVRLAALREPPFCNYYNINAIPADKLNYSFDVALEYLRCNYKNQKAYKNLLECCEILRDGQMGRRKSIWLFHLIDVMFQLIDDTNLEVSPSIRPVFLHLLQILAKSHFRSTIFQSSNKKLRINKNWFQTISLAFNYTDPEVLYEFASFFYLSFHHPSPEEKQLEKYARLVWEHMLPIAQEGTHHELLGIVIALLIRIDLDTPKSILDILNIKRHRDIPKLVGKILEDFCSVYAIVEKIIACLISVDTKQPVQIHISDGQHWARTKIGYLEWLDSEVLPKSVKVALDQLIRGVCVVIKSECADEIKRDALTEINSVVKTLLINDDEPHRLLKRLIRSGILETLFIVRTCPLYSSSLQQLASEELPRIKKHVIEKLGPKEQIPAKVVCVFLGVHLHLDGDKKESDLEDRANKLAQFLVVDSRCKKMNQKEAKKVQTDELGILSYISDILDYQRNDWGTSECY